MLERQIAIAITDQVRDCNVFKEIAANSQEIASLQAQKLEGEVKRFGTGRSDTDTVIRFQEDLERAWQELGGQELICEGFVHFEAECSIIAARDRNGEAVFWPLTMIFMTSPDSVVV